jgi:hypothetical protein
VETVLSAAMAESPSTRELCVASVSGVCVP